MSAPFTVRRAASIIIVAAPLTVLGCGKLDHFGKPPTMSSVALPRDPVDPSLPPAQTDIARYSVIAPRAGPPLREGVVDPRYGAAGPADPRGPVGRYDQPYAAGYDPSFATASIGRQRAQAASLWSSQPSSLFGDRRARRVGDILTVLIEISDSASINNTTTRSRDGSDEITAANVFGIQNLIDEILPRDVEISNGLEAGGNSSSTGEGTVDRGEDISLRIAATVVQILPNGYFVISGNQEVRVNFELRDLQVAGVIRPEDISRGNTITYDKIANARISYGGRGQITDFQQPRYGQQFVDLISPF